MSEPGSYPSFKVALEQFREFARDQGAPEQVMFLTPHDVALVSGETYVRIPDALASVDRAERRYQATSARRLGVVINGFCTLGGSLCAYVYGPTDDDEAARLMFPDGLKLGIAATLRPATPASGANWLILRLREALAPDRQWKLELFK